MDKQEIKAILADVRKSRTEKGAQVLAELENYKHLTYPAFLRQRARDWSDRVALIHKDRKTTYAELFRRIDGMCGALRRRGVKPGDAVALLLDNSDNYVVCFLAVLSMGAVAIPLNTKLVAREVKYIVENSRAIMALSHPMFAAVWDQVGKERPGLCPVHMAEDLMAEASPEAPAASASPIPDYNVAAGVYYTSGTTGSPKGVVHTHRAIISDALQNPHAWEYDFDGLIGLAATPMFHIASNAVFLPLLSLGGTLIIDNFHTESTLALLDRHKVNSFFAVPSMLILLVEKARETGLVLPALRSLQFGAAPMPIQRLGEVQALFPNAGLVHGMGQTESCGVLVTLPSRLAFACAGSIGIAMAGVEVTFFDSQDREVAPNEVGEMVGRGPNMMWHYFDNPSATQETLRGGWLHTGDLGYYDELGLTYLVDRKKDMIIRGGENIYSTEVEQVLLMHPAVAQAAVVGKPDKLFGEQVLAFIVPRDPAGIDVQSVIAHCRTHLASFKVPVEIRLAEAFPMTATGKIQKGELRKLVEAK